MAKPKNISSEDVDRTSEGSFPASDPPAWTMGSEAEAAKRRNNQEKAAARQSSPAHPSPQQSAASDSYEGAMVAILATDGFEQSELLEPKLALEKLGICVDVISLKKGRIKAWYHKNWGQEVDVDIDIDSADVNSYDALVLPGGVMNPDTLRQDERAVALVKAFAEQQKPIAAICHGPWMLVEAGLVRGRRLTSWPSLKTDISNAGGKWIDKSVVEDGNLVTSRKPDDLPDFNRKLLEMIARVVAYAPSAEHAT